MKKCWIGGAVISGEEERYAQQSPAASCCEKSMLRAQLELGIVRDLRLQKRSGTQTSQAINGPYFATSRQHGFGQQEVPAKD